MAIGRTKLLAGVRGALFAMVAATAGVAWMTDGLHSGMIVLLTAYAALHACLLREVTEEDLHLCRVGGCTALLDTALVAGTLVFLPEYRWELMWTVFLYGLLASALPRPAMGWILTGLVAGLYAGLWILDPRMWRAPDATWWGLGAGTLAVVVFYASGMMAGHGHHHKPKVEGPPLEEPETLNFELGRENRSLRSQLAEAREGWHHSFQGLPTAMVVVDGRGRVLEANEAFRSLGHFGTRDLKGRGLFEALQGIWFPDGQSVAPEWMHEAPEGAIRLVIPSLNGEFEVTKGPVLGSLDAEGGAVWVFRRRSA